MINFHHPRPLLNQNQTDSSVAGFGFSRQLVLDIYFAKESTNLITFIHKLTNRLGQLPVYIFKFLPPQNRYKFIKRKKSLGSELKIQ